MEKKRSEDQRNKLMWVKIKYLELTWCAKDDHEEEAGAEEEVHLL